MIQRKIANRKLIATIDALFSELVGPIAQFIVEDAKATWKEKQWKGPAALRHYISLLAKNIDQGSEKMEFLKKTNELVMNSSLSEPK